MDAVDLQDGGDVVACVDVVDDVSGEVYGGVVHQDGATVSLPADAVETGLDRAGELTDVPLVGAGEHGDPQVLCRAEQRPGPRALLDTDRDQCWFQGESHIGSDDQADRMSVDELRRQW
jgi:hypothetical protein